MDAGCELDGVLFRKIDTQKVPSAFASEDDFRDSEDGSGCPGTSTSVHILNKLLATDLAGLVRDMRLEAL